MSNTFLLMRLKDSILRNKKNCDTKQLKTLCRLYVYDTKGYKDFSKQLDNCSTIEELLIVIDTALQKSIDKDCSDIGGLTANPTSVTNILMHLKPAFLDFIYTYEKEDLPFVIGGYIVQALEVYVGHGISEEYFDNFKNQLYTFDKIEDLNYFIDSVIEHGQKYDN